MRPSCFTSCFFLDVQVDARCIRGRDGGGGLGERSFLTGASIEGGLNRWPSNDARADALSVVLSVLDVFSRFDWNLASVCEKLERRRGDRPVVPTVQYELKLLVVSE